MGEKSGAARAAGNSLRVPRKPPKGVPAADDAYGECFPEAGFGHALNSTSKGESDDEEIDKKKRKGADDGQDSVSANQRAGMDGKKRKLSEDQQWNKIDKMIKKGKLSSIEELEAGNAKQRRAPAPRDRNACLFLVIVMLPCQSGEK